MMSETGFSRFGAFGLRPGGGRRFVGAGTKMYLSYGETLAWLAGLRERFDGRADVGVFALPSFPALGDAARILAGSSLLYGAQNAHAEHKGPFTGEVSPAFLAEMGCSLVELGHAERRALYGETDEVIAGKVAGALTSGLVPILCVGERQRSADGRGAADFVAGQVRAALGSAGTPEAALIVAYEPIWAIGQAESAPPAYIAPVIAAIRAELAATWPGLGTIIYGGSVNYDAAPELFATGVDGLFVGRASYNLDNFEKIVQAVAEA